MSVKRGCPPPSAVDLLRRAHLIDKLDNLDDLWVEWQSWFAELEETHTSLPFVNFFPFTRPAPVVDHCVRRGARRRLRS